MKVDLQKAYDRLERNLIVIILLKFGFSDRWISMVMQLISTTTAYIVFINCAERGHFIPSRGIGQGKEVLIKAADLPTSNFVVSHPSFHPLFTNLFKRLLQTSFGAMEINKKVSSGFVDIDLPYLRKMGGWD
ncbi:hypothetical protein NE237_009902 [Protea cynaroides]|uniref:Reverse transcriptase n=1 Tax=Protea cynaroides TaxID=273540 RepID=A0A9Q0R135_9MAGN|nr:hypothetical protein NE237_009902 [Protea cynaroides]